MPATEVQLEGIAEIASVGDDGAFLARYQWLDSRGVHTRFDQGSLLYSPAGWYAFWHECVGDSPYTAYGDACGALLALYLLWDWNARATAGIEAVERGEQGFRDLLEANPDVETHPAVQQTIVERVRDGSLPPNKAGTKKSSEPGVRELIHWAAWYLRREVATLDEACERAISEHSEHLPASWDPDNAVQTLKRTIKRYGRMPEP